VVTGPAGEEIYPDEYGRVKVQFHWDRLGKMDENTSCWIRASQGWAGSEYGTMAIPRIGQEVIVSFLEGNPDRPLITGRVNNALNMPSYDLPKHKTRTVFKSMSTPGEEYQPRGFNELRIEDQRGVEEIYLHAEKDVNLHVKNDWKEHILHDQHCTVDHCTYVKTDGETHETLKGPRKTELFADDNCTVHGNSHLVIDDKWLARVGDELHIRAGGKIVFEAGMELTIIVGGHWIRITPAGITTSPIVHVGSGSPGIGSGASPLLPLGSVVTEVAQAPRSQLCALKAALDSPICKKYAPGEEVAFEKEVPADARADGGNLPPYTGPCKDQGMADQQQIDDFAKKSKAMQKDWPQLSPADRAQRMKDLIDAQAAKNGFPPPELKTVPLPPRKEGRFIPGDWKIEINRALVNKPSLSNDDTAKIGEVLYHETRHAEQRFLVARRQADEGLDVETMARSLGLKKNIMAVAQHDPLTASDLRRSCADKLHASQYGVDRGALDKAYAELSNANTVLEGAKDADANAPTWMTLAARLKAEAARETAWEAYARLPGEADALDAGGRVADAINPRL
jgi:hypothetical protein